MSKFKINFVKGLPIVFLVSGISLLCEQQVKARELPLDMQITLSVSTSDELEQRIKETIIIPEAIHTEDKAAEGKDKSITTSMNHSEEVLLPLDLKVELGYKTKAELDAALVIKTTGPEFNSGEKERAEDMEESILPEAVSQEGIPQEGNLPEEWLQSSATSQQDFSREDLMVYSKVIMVGDSRFVGMNTVADNPIFQWICDVSKGYDWLVTDASPAIDSSIIPGSAIVINLGINDVYRPVDYVNYINSKVDEWIGKGADVFYMSVNPVLDGYGGGASNALVESFNSTLVSSLSEKIGYIDTYNYLIQNGYGTQDGLHYDSPTYSGILGYCQRQLRIP